MTDNIIHLPLRHNVRLGERRQTLAEQLRATARLPKSDRPIMALNLGKMAARFNGGNPIDALKSIFEIAWPGDSTKWAKRKRLVRMPGEEMGDPEDYGSYEASGAPYLLLAHAIARLSLPSEKAENLSAEEERRVAELLWGTSLRPGASLVDETTVDARNLMVQLGSTVAAQMTETGIQKLWETLQDSPFRKINVEFAIENRNFGEDLIPIKGADGEVLNFHNAQEFGELYGLHIEWSRPKIFIGWLLRKFDVDLLLPPEAIGLHADQDENPDDPELKKLEAWADEWADVGPDGKKDTLPSHSYDDDLGHGWAKAQFDVAYRVYVRADPDGMGGIKIDIFFEDGAGDGNGAVMIPYSQIIHSKNTGNIENYLETIYDSSTRTYCDDGVFSGYFKHYVPEELEGDLIFWVRDYYTGEISNLSNRIRPGKLLGLVSFPDGYDTPNPPKEITLSEMADGEAAGILVGTTEMHFVSVLHEVAGAPVPCRANSLAASLLRNSICEDEECRLSYRLRENAHKISEEGLEFFNGVIDLYRRSIK
ncbi:hypothetical protein H7F50_18765 [Novosphingobium flavum]|uniref:hypothetical protein n=1 Tax=Novosphingobium aerophilum TaxID=2839843 RepID=UPI00163A66F9|nr:hypothetical protein [Novosphingobium aerophilum]MBC2663763.1 hypothetical protein [Novosphingobium aerophilum]